MPKAINPDWSKMAELDTAMIGMAVDTAELIAENSDVWVRGNAGEELSASEHGVYSETLSIINTRLVVMESHAGQLGRDDTAYLIRRDWAAFLHQNPGVRRAWLAREDNLIKYRRLLAPDAPDFSAWREAILSEPAILDQEIE